MGQKPTELHGGARRQSRDSGLDELAQLVEHLLAKETVAGSNPAFVKHKAKAFTRSETKASLTLGPFGGTEAGRARKATLVRYEE